MAEQRVLMGVIGRPHGVRGHVHVRSFTADPAGLTAYGPLDDERGRRFRLRWASEGVAEIAEIVGGRPVVVRDRAAAEALVNLRLFIDRAALPEPAADEFYLADLIGLAAVSPEGAAIGAVTAVHDYGGGASLEIGAALVPFTRACVPEVDLAARRLVVVMPEEVIVPEARP